MSDKEKQINDAKQELYRAISDVKKNREKKLMLITSKKDYKI